jgi:hypothetical protein
LSPVADDQIVHSFGSFIIGGHFFAKVMGISFGSFQAILTDVYGMSNVSARWFSRLLTCDQKRTRLDISRYLLSRYEDIPDCIYRIKTQDKHGPITSIQNKKGHAEEAPWLTPPKKFKRVPSAGMMVASIFRKVRG